MSSRIADRVRERVAAYAGPTGDELEEDPLESARRRRIDGTSLLFDKESILLLVEGSTDKLDPSGPFDKARRAEQFHLAFADTTIGVDIETGKPANFSTNVADPPGILIPLADDVCDRMREHAVEKLEAAWAAGADAVVFPEFALPPVDVPDLIGIEVFNPFDPAHQEWVDRRFEKEATDIRDRARERLGTDVQDVPFTFYGSMHCRRSRYNIGVVSPGRPFEQGYSLVTTRANPISGDEKPSGDPVQSKIGPLVHKKRFPARRAGEDARVPGGLRFRLYPSKIGDIAVLICSDAIDLNQFWYIVRHNQRADGTRDFDRIALVIVPAYSQSELLQTTCKDLSILAHTTVFVGNASGKIATGNRLYPKAMPAPAFYQCGAEQQELCDRKVLSIDIGVVRSYRFRPAPPAF